VLARDWLVWFFSRVRAWAQAWHEPFFLCSNSAWQGVILVRAQARLLNSSTPFTTLIPRCIFYGLNLRNKSEYVEDDERPLSSPLALLEVVFSRSWRTTWRGYQRIVGLEVFDVALLTSYKWHIQMVDFHTKRESFNHEEETFDREKFKEHTKM
jgi:hypothetical protein